MNGAQTYTIQNIYSSNTKQPQRIFLVNQVQTCFWWKKYLYHTL